MMADLGLTRRDIVSAPDEDFKKNRVQIDPRAQATAVADFRARRSQITAEDTGDDVRAARLRAWNSESTFAFERISLTTL